MREIKFRCWNSFANVMQSWKEMKDHGDFYRLLEQADKYPLMQYTGLKDKNGTEIYEGDVLRAKVDEYSKGEHEEDCDIPSRSGKLFTGKQIDAVWVCEYVDWSAFHGVRFYGLNRRFNVKATRGVIDSCSVEVIGNIHESPELIK